MAGGRLLEIVFPLKQSPPAAGAPRARSARPESRTTLSRTTLPELTQRFASRLGITAMP